VDNVVRLAPAHPEEVLGGFGGNGTQAADENDVPGFEFREEDWEEVAEGVIEEDVEDEANYWRCCIQKLRCEAYGGIAGINRFLEQMCVYLQWSKL